jgi:tetratricopeptide (TPR) repeat protein
MQLFSNRKTLTARATSLTTLCLVILATTALPAEQPRSAALEAARLNNLGTALMGQQFLDKAVIQFAGAIKADPSLALAKTNEAVALLYLQKLPEAQQLLDTAALADPKDPHVWYALGLLYRNQNQPQQALESFQKVLALKPNDPDTNYMVASLYLELNDFPAATAAYRKTIALEPHHASAIFGLARVLRRQGDTAGAQESLARFQHISSAKLGFPLSHNYGEEGLYGRVEDASLAPTRVDPMIPVTFTESWHAHSSTTPTPASACLINLSSNDQPALLLLSSGDDAVHLYDRVGTTRLAELPAAQTGLHIPGTGLACAVGDYDNDGLPDLALAITDPTGHDHILLYRNLGNGKFEDVTAASTITPTTHPSSLTFVDYDHDGDLDLFITGTPTAASASPNTLWRNNGNKTFTDWTKEANLGGSTPTTAAILTDLNNDRAVDLLVAGAATSPTFFANHREGPFGSSPLFAANLPPTVSVTTLDFNKDGNMDVLLSHSGAPGVTLWRNVDGNSFERVDLPLPGILSATAAIPIDFDNDGWIDLALLVQTQQGPQLRILRNLGPAGFADVSAQLHLNDLHLHSPRSLLAADVNHTGASDLILTDADGSAHLLTNQGGNRNHSLHIVLHGAADNKSGIGTKIQVFANGLWQKWEDTGQPEILAGLGSSEQADLVRLLWPTGVPQDEIDVASTDKLPITELDRRGSSCPTLFAWNGHHYSFITDVIGAAVIGHWVSPTAHNIPDPDEWIKVDGSQLQQRNGLFSLRFGEPMEEVNFVDQVRLVAIDHPSATAVYPNEGFLSEPPFAQAKTIVAAAPHPLLSATDNNGQNVLPLLSTPLAHPCTSGCIEGAKLPSEAVSSASARFEGAKLPSEAVSSESARFEGAKLPSEAVSSASARFEGAGLPPEAISSQSARFEGAKLPSEAVSSQSARFEGAKLPSEAVSSASAHFEGAGLQSRHNLPVCTAALAAEGEANGSCIHSVPPTPTYVRDFTNLPFAGFANLHSLTIDIGPWSPQQPLRLLLHGFIEYFSASSMYAAWQAGLSPIPPFIEAQNPDGTWHKIVSDMGFPAGLPRTVTVDLTNKLPLGATHLRITTNLQIYWDQALVDNEPTPTQHPTEAVHATDLPLAHATLAFRGYPRQVDGHTPGDLTYNYQQISSAGPFIPHRGAYTRYGDVTPLLHSIDDEFVIFGTGEDMDLEFRAAALPPLPKGWSRDYFFYANGYVKDMDFYEARPFNVDALPFHNMSTYPYPPTEHYPTDTAHTAYQLEYNTRFESGTTDRPYQFNYQPSTQTPSF